MSGSTLSMFSIQQPGGNVKRPCNPYKSYNFYSFDTPSGRLDGPGGGVHFVGIVGIVAFDVRLASRLPSPSQSAYASCATSPTGRGKSTPVGSGQAMVRQTCSRLRLTTLFAGIDGGTLGSPRGGTNSDRCQRQKQGAVSGAALRFLQAPAAARRKNRLSARGGGTGRASGL